MIIILNKVICGPFCSLFYLGISIFAVVMLLTLATLIKNEYPYTGVTFEDSGEGVTARAQTVKGCFNAVIVYVVFGIYAGISIVYNRAKKKL